jgi:hypothetical protein
MTLIVSLSSNGILVETVPLLANELDYYRNANFRAIYRHK